MPKADVEGYSCRPMNTARQPVLIILAGPNGSGKTTFASQLLEHKWGEELQGH